MAYQREAVDLLRTSADTTWRMVVPTAVLVPLGLLGDTRLSSAPWLTLSALGIGLGLSIWLVRAQLRRAA